MPIDREPGANYPSHEWETGCGYYACTPPIEELCGDADQAVAAALSQQQMSAPKYLLTRQELRDFSEATVPLRTALDLLPEGSVRELVLQAQRKILRVLDDIATRDRSWQ